MIRYQRCLNVVSLIVHLGSIPYRSTCILWIYCAFLSTGKLVSKLIRATHSIHVVFYTSVNSCCSSSLKLFYIFFLNLICIRWFLVSFESHRKAFLLHINLVFGYHLKRQIGLVLIKRAIIHRARQSCSCIADVSTREVIQLLLSCNLARIIVLHSRLDVLAETRHLRNWLIQCIIMSAILLILLGWLLNYKLTGLAKTWISAHFKLFIALSHPLYWKSLEGSLPSSIWACRCLLPLNDLGLVILDQGRIIS